jgi:hypothetical protein
MYESEVSEILGAHGGEYEDDVFWDVLPCTLVQIGRRFRRAYWLHDQGPDDGGQ